MLVYKGGHNMLNEVSISGLIKDIQEDNDKHMAVIEVTRRYGADNQSVNTFNVLLPAGGGLKAAFKWAQEKKKPLYAAIRGVVANRKFSEDDKYANHTLIVALNVGAVGTGSDSQWSSAAFVGEVVFAKFQYTSKGTPFARVLLKNTRVVKVKGEEKNFTSSIFVTIYNVDDDQAHLFKKGEKVFVAGRLDSYESNDNPGAYITTMVVDEFWSLGSVDVDTVKKQEAAVNEAVEEDDSDDDELPF